MPFGNGNSECVSLHGKARSNIFVLFGYLSRCSLYDLQCVDVAMVVWVDRRI